MQCCVGCNWLCNSHCTNAMQHSFTTALASMISRLIVSIRAIAAIVCNAAVIVSAFVKRNLVFSRLLEMKVYVKEFSGLTCQGHVMPRRLEPRVLYCLRSALLFSACAMLRRQYLVSRYFSRHLQRQHATNSCCACFGACAMCKF